MFYRAFAVAIVRRYGFNRRDDHLRGHRLGSLLGRLRLNHGFDGRWFRRFLASSRQDWLLADRRNGNLQMRFATARNFRAGRGCRKTAAAPASTGSWAQQEYKMRSS